MAIIAASAINNPPSSARFADIRSGNTWSPSRIRPVPDSAPAP